MNPYEMKPTVLVGELVGEWGEHSGHSDNCECPHDWWVGGRNLGGALQRFRNRKVRITITIVEEVAEPMPVFTSPYRKYPHNGVGAIAA